MDQPTPVNEHNVYDQLVLFTNPEMVKNVFVNGKCLKKDGVITVIDKEAAKHTLRDITEKFWNVREANV